MFLWRISNHAELTGRGAERASGRWHTAAEGKRIVYLAEHPAVALIENLVNLRGDPTFFGRHFQLLKIAVSDSLLSSELTGQQRASIQPHELAPTRALGDEWIASGCSALLRVPSIPAPESWNYLLNPLHPEALKIKLEWARTLAYDNRLFHLGAHA